MIRERTLSNIICENSYPEFKVSKVLNRDWIQLGQIPADRILYAKEVLTHYIL